MVGHVDLKFVLNPNTINIPQIQVTLLKNKAPGLGKVTGEDIHCSISSVPPRMWMDRCGRQSSFVFFDI